ncbi:MAG TPA: DUF2497 domain-containing protein [Stellaceae bacterium]|jgi:hypothetical protein|nr:DUF2497 domain-containing protein [Stellaceae bacterium]
MSDTKPATEPTMEEILATIRRIIADDERQGAGGVVGAKRDDNVLVLTEAVEADGSVRHIAPAAARGAVPPLPDGRVEPEPPRPAVADGAPTIRGERLSPSPATESLGSAFTRVSAPGDRAAPETSLGRGDKTLEDIVRELLRPMLQTWIDEKLPTLVEGLVQKEIARVAGEARRT